MPVTPSRLTTPITARTHIRPVHCYRTATLEDNLQSGLTSGMQRAYKPICAASMPRARAALYSSRLMAFSIGRGEKFKM